MSTDAAIVVGGAPTRPRRGGGGVTGSHEYGMEFKVHIHNIRKPWNSPEKFLDLPLL